LRIIGTIYKVLGGIAAVITILSALGICVSSVFGGAALNEWSREYGGIGSLGLFGGVLGGLIGGLVAIITGGLTAIGLYAMGEGVYLLLAIEENTRSTAALLRKIE
jgi:hypothetical protein